MKRLIAVIGALALVALVGGAGTARAEPTQLVAVNCTFLSAFGDGCTDGISDAEVAQILAADGTTAPTLADLAAMSAAQVSAFTNSRLALFAFVDDDEPVTFDVPTSLTVLHGTIPGGDFVCDTEDEDCDADGTPGDGVVAVVVGASPTGDFSGVVSVSQEGVILTLEVAIVGHPTRIAIFETEEVVAAGGDDCTEQAAEQADDLDKLLLEAVVSDTAGHQLVGMAVYWQVDDPSIALIDTLTFVTVDNGSRISARAILCGQDAGDVVVTATTTVAPVTPASVTKTVVGEPANIALVADPAVIECDGVNSSTVTATVTDANGNPVVPGTTVLFEPVTLATANPVVALTSETGTATSTITPLAAADVGVVVTVSSGDAMSQIRIDCLAEPEPPAEECLSAGHKNAIARNVERRMGAETGERGYHAKFDVNNDGAIDAADLAAVAAIPVCERGKS